MSCPNLIYRTRVHRPIGVGDGYGGDSTPLEIIDPSMKCYVTIRSTRDLLGAGKDAAADEITGYFAFDADIKRGDRMEYVQDQRERDIIDTPLSVDVVTLKMGLRGGGFKTAKLRRVS